MTITFVTDIITSDLFTLRTKTVRIKSVIQNCSKKHAAVYCGDNTEVKYGNSNNYRRFTGNRSVYR